MIIDLEKVCGACGQTKSAAEFHADKSRSDGLQYRCKVCRRAHYLANPDRTKEIAREWQKANPERRLEYTRKWRDANRDHKREANRRWRENNLDKARAVARNYEYRRRVKMTDGGLTGKALLAWESAQPKVCHWCGKKCAADYEVDHREPLARGGRHDLRNLVIACAPCNRRKSARCPVEFAQSMGRLV